MELSWSEKLMVLRCLKSISETILLKHNGLYLEPDLESISIVRCSELTDDCYDLIKDSWLSELEQKYDVAIRSIPVSKLFVEAPVEFIQGYTMGVDCFLDNRELDIRVFNLDYSDYPKVKSLLKYVNMGDGHKVSFENFSNREGILWLHMEDSFIESTYTEEGRVDVSDPNLVSEETLKVMNWVDSTKEDICELYILVNENLSKAYFLPKGDGEFSVLVY